MPEKNQDASHEEPRLLFVSHNLTSRPGMCNRAMCIHSGELRDQGKPETVIANYLKEVAVEERRLVEAIFPLVWN